MSNICACGMRLPWRHSGKGGQRKVCDSCREDKERAKSRNRARRDRARKLAQLNSGGNRESQP